MKVLVINAGSSSVKYQLIQTDDESVVAKGGIERIGIPGSNLSQTVGGKKYEVAKDLADHNAAFELMLSCLTSPDFGGAVKDISEIEAIGHRVLHTGTDFHGSVEVDAEVERLLRENIHLGPLHMPANIAGIDACIKALPGVPNVAVFDTAFHTTMPDKACMYAIPYEDYEQFKIKKYGFHGTSHKYVSGCAIDYLKSKGLPWDKIVTCHLGNGSSITAVKDGKSVDTSMGMTPLEGVPMGTRSGDIDASVVEMLCSWKGMTPQQVVTYLNKQSGFQGVSGVSSDSRNVLEAAEKGNYRAQLAMDMFTYRVKKYIGSYAAAMGGLDCIVMTGGIGENSGPLRKGILEGLEFLGVELDGEINANVRQPKCIHEINAADSRVKILVIPTNEELVIARETRDVVTAAKR